MVQAMIKLGEFHDRVLMIIRGKYGLRNKSDAVSFIIEQYAEMELEPEMMPRYAKKLSKIENEKSIRFKSIDQLKKHIKNA